MKKKVTLSAIGLVEVYSASRKQAVKYMQATERGKYIEASKHYAKLKPKALGESRDKIKAVLEADLRADGLINDDTPKRRIGAMLKAHINGLYRVWGILGSGTDKTPYRYDKEKVAEQATKDKETLAMSQADVKLMMKNLGF